MVPLGDNERGLVDALDEPARVEALRTRTAQDQRKFFAISSVTGEGVRELIHFVAREVEQQRTHKLPAPAHVTGDELLIGSGSRF